MLFATHSRAVGDLLRAGAFDFLHGFMARGRLPRDIEARLQDKFGRLTPVSRQAASAIVDRFRAAREAGQRLERRVSDRPLSDAQHVGFVLDDSKYGYETIVTLFDHNQKKTITVPIFVQDNSTLSRREVHERAIEAIQDLIARRKVGSPPSDHQDYSMVGAPQITMAYGQSRER